LLDVAREQGHWLAIHFHHEHAIVDISRNTQNGLSAAAIEELTEGLQLQIHRAQYRLLTPSLTPKSRQNGARIVFLFDA
jgi:hypothetical protein